MKYSELRARAERAERLLQQEMQAKFELVRKSPSQQTMKLACRQSVDRLSLMQVVNTEGLERSIVTGAAREMALFLVREGLITINRRVPAEEPYLYNYDFSLLVVKP